MLFSALAFFTNITFLGFKHADRWWFPVLDRCDISYLLPLLYIFFIIWLYYYVYWLLNDRDLGCFQGFLFVCLFAITHYYQETYGRDTERHNPDPLPKRGSLAHLLRGAAAAQPSVRLHLPEITLSFIQGYLLPGTTHNQWLDERTNTWSTVEATQLRRSPWPQGCRPHHSLRPPLPHSSSLPSPLSSSLDPNAACLVNLHIELCQHSQIKEEIWLSQYMGQACGKGSHGEAQKHIWGSNLIGHQACSSLKRDPTS